MDGIRFILEDPQAAGSRQKKRSRLVTACDTWYVVVLTSDSHRGIRSANRDSVISQYMSLPLAEQKRSSVTSLRRHPSVRHVGCPRRHVGSVTVSVTMRNVQAASLLQVQLSHPTVTMPRRSQTHQALPVIAPPCRPFLNTAHRAMVVHPLFHLPLLVFQKLHWVWRNETVVLWREQLRILHSAHRRCMCKLQKYTC